MSDIQALRWQGLSISQISALTGFNRRTIRKYLAQPDIPQYGPRPPRPSKLDPFKDYLDQRLQAGVWNAVVLLREIQARGYTGATPFSRSMSIPSVSARKQWRCVASRPRPAIKPRWTGAM
ncbi:MAG TPA: hypothetical protein VFB38_21000 [Chthonomonadaceae bacterium]|nr:hypothetical protein [Chthonomonadaceae bacterium]